MPVSAKLKFSWSLVSRHDPSMNSLHRDRHREETSVVAVFSSIVQNGEIQSLGTGRGDDALRDPAAGHFPLDTLTLAAG